MVDERGCAGEVGWGDGEIAGGRTSVERESWGFSEGVLGVVVSEGSSGPFESMSIGSETGSSGFVFSPAIGVLALGGASSGFMFGVCWLASAA